MSVYVIRSCTRLCGNLVSVSRPRRVESIFSRSLEQKAAGTVKRLFEETLCCCSFILKVSSRALKEEKVLVDCENAES